MELFGFSRLGFEGQPVAVEIDVRPRGLPGIDLVGLPDSAVREAKERVRSGVRNSGYTIPRGRILINLAPAGIRKEGAGFDLPIALALVGASLGWFQGAGPGPRLMALGELQLSAAVKPVRGVLSAASTALKEGLDYLIVPAANLGEARSLGIEAVIGIASLAEGIAAVEAILDGRAIPSPDRSGQPPPEESLRPGEALDFSDLKGQSLMKRGMEIAAAGGHHCLLFGPPGCGKTMIAMRLAGILPGLQREEAIELTKIYSIAGKLSCEEQLIHRPQWRMPHHSSSLQGILGGGPGLLPGEISLAHRGVLVLDEAPEFSKHLLQNLREPMERREVRIARAGRSVWYPAGFQLVMTANPCPCGNLGRRKGVCICSHDEIARYWRKIGGPLLDRIDIRIPVEPRQEEILEASSSVGESSGLIRGRVEAARRFRIVERGQQLRNGELSPVELEERIRLSDACTRLLARASERLDLSSRAIHSIQRVARTIGDLKLEADISTDSIKEAILFRRYGDTNLLWAKR